MKHGKFNRFQFENRTLKVHAILTYLDASLGLSAATGAGLVRCAAMLAAMPQDARDTIAAAAGQHSPSDVTWRQVVEGVLAYRTLDNVLMEVA